MFRFNPDERIRNLTRAAAAGDPQAGQALLQELYRSGQLTPAVFMGLPDTARRLIGEIADQLPVGWWASVRIDDIRQAAGSNTVLDEFLRLAHLVRTTPANTGTHGGWFPGHDGTASVCPRGHQLGDVTFYLEEFAGTTRPVHHFDEEQEGWVVGGWPETGDDYEPHMTCSECWAHWPSGPIAEYE